MTAAAEFGLEFVDQIDNIEEAAAELLRMGTDNSDSQMLDAPAGTTDQEGHWINHVALRLQARASCQLDTNMPVIMSRMVSNIDSLPLIFLMSVGVQAPFTSW